MAQVNIRMDDDLKANADTLFDELGLNMSTAVNMFLKQALRQGGIPFAITTNGDPFYSETNQARIRETLKNYDPDKLIYKTMAELEAMADE